MSRYCIGCIHFYLRPQDPGRMGSEWTGRYGEENAALLCKRGHWSEELQPGQEIAFGENMTRAKNCPDFEERDHGI